MKSYTIIFVFLLLLPFSAKADVICQYDCLAKGGLPEVCNARCGITGDGSSASGGSKKDGADKEDDRGGDGSSASGGGKHDAEYFACIKECREADNTLSDCKKLCGSE